MVLKSRMCGRGFLCSGGFAHSFNPRIVFDPFRVSGFGKPPALQQLRALPREHRRNIGWRLDALQNDFVGDVKKLSGRTQEYRLRAGSFRVAFMLESDLITVYPVKDRKEAYE